MQKAEVSRYMMRALRFRDSPVLVRALLLLPALLLVLAAQGASAEPNYSASLINLNRLIYDPTFPAGAIQGWLEKRNSPLANIQTVVGDANSKPGLVLATAAARDGINPKVLLTWLELNNGVTNGTVSFGLSGTFPEQADKVTRLLREGLLPTVVGSPYNLSDGSQVVASGATDAGSYALGRALAAASDRPGWTRVTSDDSTGFVATYRRLFGEDPRAPQSLAATSGPFLTSPLYASFVHRSYFDHTYPTVDYGSDGNPLMTGFDGQYGRNYDSHDGHDYEVPTGTPIYAAAAGTAYFLRSNDCGDPNTLGVLIRHANGYETIYWHMSGLASDPGTSRDVDGGAWLGNSGQSGCASSAPHLHFEVRHNGLETDPYGWSGSGGDPCPGLSGQPQRYVGCEASSYLWQSAPDGVGAVVTPVPTLTPTQTPTPAPPAPSPVCDAGNIYMSNDVNKAVPPSGTQGTTTSQITIANAATINTLRVVNLSFQHSYAGDLDVTLISPNGTRVRLFDDVCNGTAWTAENTHFSLGDLSGAYMGVGCPPAGESYRPLDSLTAFSGQSANGTWTLEVVDDANYDSGTLLSWGIEINGANCTIAPTPTPGPCTNGFSDVQQTDYFYEPVHALLCDGIISGYSDGTFRPFAGVTRAQLLKMVALAEGWNLSSPPTASFSDVAQGDWFYPYVETAVAKGVVAGYADHTFRPFNTINRGQIAKIIALAASWFLATPPTPTFSDVPLDNPYYTYIETAAVRRVMGGYADGTFHPFDLAVRSQVAKVLYSRLTGR